jgi:hypothetical protein
MTSEVSTEVELDQGGEGFAPDAGTEVEAGVGDAAGEVAPASEPEPEPDFSIGEDGELKISDRVLDEHVPAEGLQKDFPTEEPAQPQPSPVENVYSAEELAKAFMENAVEMDRLPEGVKDYHRAIMEEQTRRQNIQELARPQIQQRLIPPPGQPPQPLQVPDFKLDREQYAQLREGSKALAAKYLGVNKQDVDEYNQEHADAVQLAMTELKNKAQELYRADVQNQYRQNVAQYQQHVQAYQQQQQQLRLNAYHEMAADFKKNPNWEDVDKNFYPKWYGALDNNTKASIMQVMQSGNVEGIKKIMNVVFDAYKAQSPTKTVEKKVIKNSPPIMSGSGAADYANEKTRLDASALAEMSPDQQAAWFSKNFV